MKRKIFFTASGIVLALGAVFGAKAMHKNKKFDTPLFYKIGTGNCTAVLCTTIVGNPCGGMGAVLYTTSTCTPAKLYNGSAIYAE